MHPVSYRFHAPALQLYYPSGLAFTADGTSLLVADRGNDRLCVFNVDAVAEENTLTLTLREAFGDLAGPIALAVCSAGLFFVLNADAATVHVFPPLA